MLMVQKSTPSSQKKVRYMVFQIIKLTCEFFFNILVISWQILGVLHLNFSELVLLTHLAHPVKQFLVRVP